MDGTLTLFMPLPAVEQTKIDQMKGVCFPFCRLMDPKKHDSIYDASTPEDVAFHEVLNS